MSVRYEFRPIPPSDALASWMTEAFWIVPPFHASAVFRREFLLDAPGKILISAAGKPGFRISIDGKFAASSVIQPTEQQVFLENFLWECSAGRHRIEVLLLDYQGCAPLSRLDGMPGFYLAAAGVYGKLLNTGSSPWKCRRENRFSFRPQEIPEFQCVGGILQADYSAEDEEPETDAPVGERGADAWNFRQVDFPSRKLALSDLPPFRREEIKSWRIRYAGAVPDGAYRMSDDRMEFHPDLSGEWTIPADSVRRVLLDLENYFCADYEFTTNASPGSRIRISWAEGLFSAPDGGEKTSREKIEGLFFRGIRDIFLPGKAPVNEFFIPDYRAGRYLEILVETGKTPLKITGFRLRENRYPLEPAEGREFKGIEKAAFRTLQMCCHDTVVDCPYYEQLAYLGDGRLQLLAIYKSASDPRIADHMLKLWTEGLRGEGMYRSIYPARTEQIIPFFSLIGILAVCDYLRYRNRREVSERIFPAALRSLLSWEGFLNGDGILEVSRGWRFVDWVKGWETGIPPLKEHVSCIFNAGYLYALSEFSEICRERGEKEFAERFSRTADALLGKIIRNFYNEEVSLFADLPGEGIFSEHANSLMILSGRLPEELLKKTADALFAEESKRSVPMAKSSLAFSFYYMSAARKAGRADAVGERLKDWSALTEKNLFTTPEEAESPRSDCHAWSAHILLFRPATGNRFPRGRNAESPISSS